VNAAVSWAGLALSLVLVAVAAGISWWQDLGLQRQILIAAARALALAWEAELAGYPTLALIAAMAQAQVPATPVLVATTGGHGEWFVQNFDSAGLPAGPLASQKPEIAAVDTTPLVAGSEAEALVARRGPMPGQGTALPLWPDARALMALPAALFTAETEPLYGRAPDARLPGGVLPA